MLEKSTRTPIGAQEASSKPAKDSHSKTYKRSGRNDNALYEHSAWTSADSTVFSLDIKAYLL
jgi:hypothetical protein